jgi:Tol biopolymer transport system component
VRPPALTVTFAGMLLAATAGAQISPAGPALGFDPTQPPTSGPLPKVNWLTLQTPHFRIHFYEEEWAFAQHAAAVAERAFRLNTRYLNWKPTGRVDIVLNDQVDQANGFASSLPYNFIYAYGAPPGTLNELNDFDDFVKLLITHEFTHVVHLDTIIGAPRLLNVLSGKIYAPNLSQPNWFIEGLAVLMETRHTTAGRLRSSYYDMHLRVPFVEGHLYGLDGVSNGPLAYPQGTAAYLYGSSLLRYIEDLYGPEKIREISHRYGSLLIPGGLNRTARQTVGVGYAALWQDWMTSLSHKFALEIEDARRRGITDAERLTYEAPGPGDTGFAPRFFPDGSFIYHRTSTDEAPAYVRMDPGTGARHILFDAHNAGPAVPTPDGRSVVFEQIAFQPLPWRVSGASHAEWDDIFVRDLETGDVRELTRGRRAHEPDISPDGRTVTFAMIEGSGRKLAILPLAGGEPRVLAPDVAGLAYSPTFSPDGRLIAYSRWKLGGYRDIHVYDLASGVDRPLAVDRALDLDPRFSPDGRFLLFSSDRTGIYNIFAYELASGRLYQVTNVIAGAFQPAVSPDGRRLVFSGFTSEGFDLFETAYEPARWPLAQPAANARLDSPTDPTAETDSPDAAPADASAPPAVERISSYQPWKYMYPHTWTLSYLSDPLGLGSSGQLQTSFGDPVGNHAVGLDVIVPAGGDASVRLDYAYSRLWPSFSLSVARSAVLASNLVIDGANVGYRQHSASASASVGLPYLRRPDASADLSFGYSYLAYAPADRLPVADPTHGITIAPETGPDANLFLSWSFSNTHSWPFSISGQEGRRLQLSLQLSQPEIGSKFHTTEITWAWTEYLTPPWARLHALALVYSGGIGIGDKRAAFAVGGFVEQDLVRSVFLNRRQCCLFLRGYPAASIVGDQFHLVSAEYRAPLLVIERGYSTFPVYLRRLSGAAFVDVGNAFYGTFDPHQLKRGVGGELRFEFKLAYYVESELQLGVARGLDTGGGNQVYFVSAFPF